MSAKGKESRTEIREPFGSGIDRYREGEAIRQNPPRPDSDANDCIFPRAQEIQPELRATNQQFQCTVALRSGQAQRGTGCVRLDARRYGFVVSYLILVSLTRASWRCAQAHKNSFQRICYRPCALINLGVSAPELPRGHTEKWLSAPYSLDSSRKSW